MKNPHQTAILVASSLFLWLATPAIAQAQILPDNSLPNNSIVTPNGSVWQIDGGTAAGSNLFHSFQEFSVPTGNEAFFNNATTIDRIITRVTGGNLSHIDGLIRANGSANLFLINPNGIVFGPNARLNIGGSFLGTTAQRLQFADGNTLSAIAPDNPILTISVPLGLQLGTNSGEIQVLGSGHGFAANNATFPPIVRDGRNTGLEVAPGQTLALVGGEVSLNGGVLTAERGRVEVGAVEGGTVTLDTVDAGWNLNYEGVETFKDVVFSARATADASGERDGAVQIVGRNVTLTDGAIALIQTDGSFAGGNLKVRASELLDIVGTNPDATISSGLLSETIAPGQGASIEVVTDDLAVVEGGGILSRTLMEGDSGAIRVNAAGLVEVRDVSPINASGFPLIGGTTTGVGNVGSLQLTARNLTLSNGGNVSLPTFSTGQGGDITLDIEESIEVVGFSAAPNVFILTAIGSTASSLGNGGNLTINTARLSVRDGGGISTNSVASGDAGALVINASESIEVAGGDPNFSQFSQIESAASIENEVVRQIFGIPDMPTGNSGNFVINTPQLTISDGGSVGVGNEGTGQAGNLQINAGEIVLLDTDAGINASTTSGEGGNITLKADRLQLRNQSQITTEAGGTGNGGNITLNVETISALENSFINANAFEGNGGNIRIAAEGIFLSPNSDITASSQLGVDGIVQIANPEIDTQAGLVNLANNPFEPSDRIVTGCGTDALENSFAFSGRGGLPPNPSRQLISDRPWSDLRDLSTFRGESPSSSPQENPPARLVEANGWIVHPDGKIELVARADNARSQQIPFDCAARTLIPRQTND